MQSFQLLAPLPSPEEMRQWDMEALRLGLPVFTLMENASRSALQVLRKVYGPLHNTRVVLFMGGGNNGGDAACLARLLLDEGAFPLLLHTRPVRASTGAAGQHLRLARACGVPTRLLSERCRTVSCLLEPWRSPHIIVDGLLGTGFRGKLREDMRSLIAFINVLGQNTPAPYIFSLDVPSGLDALTGQAQKDTVQASATVSFAAAKPGLVLPEARLFTGHLFVCDIGIPQRVREAVLPSFRLIDKRCASLLPALLPAAYKNAFGHILVLGGSLGLTGAPHLAALAALRSGAGLVTAGTPSALAAEVKGGLADIMILPLSAPAGLTASSAPTTPTASSEPTTPTASSAPTTPTAPSAPTTPTAPSAPTTPAAFAWPRDLPEDLARLLPSVAALVIGPGMGRSESAADFLRIVLATAQRPPAVLDADALVILADHPDMFEFLTSADVLTPHPGEAGRLLRQPAAAVQRDRQHCLHRLMELAPACWVLKGAGTLIGQRGMPVLVSPYDIPTLAVGGSGDVLAGCTAALMARTSSSLHAALLAVAVHARAGYLLLANFPQRGNLASDIAHTLPAALSSLQQLPEIYHVEV